jgi:uncharacterized protein YxjI
MLVPESILADSVFFIAESTGLTKAANSYKVFDSKGNAVGMLQESIPNFFKKLLKFTPLKNLLSFKIIFSDNNNQKIFILNRSFTFLLSKVFVKDTDGKTLGYFKQKLRLWRGRFDLFNDTGQFAVSIRGDWRDWNFKILDSKKNKVGVINKKWDGFFREIFTTNDSYLVKIEKPISPQEKALILSSAVVIDMVLKEYS